MILKPKTRILKEYPDGMRIVEYTTYGYIDGDGIQMHYVSWGNKTRALAGPYFQLGVSGGAANKRSAGAYNNPKRLLWDLAYGYVNGFRKRDILWYVLTRTLAPWKKREV